MVVLLSAFSIAQKATAEPDNYKVPEITNLNYAKARLMLIQAGWKPAPTVGVNDELWGQAKVFQDAGFREINDCAGTGSAPCIMYFRDLRGNVLKVVTQGEATLEGADFPVVDNYQLVDHLPTIGEPVDTPSQTPPKPVAVAPAKNDPKTPIEIAAEEAKRVPPDADCVQTGKVGRYIAEQRDNRVAANVVLANIDQKYKNLANIIYRHPEVSPSDIEINTPISCMASKITLRKMGY